MSIVRCRPDPDEEQIRPGQSVLVDTDAPSNMAAILEIERWCDARGMVRVPELHLSTVRADGRLLRRGRCYLPTEGEIGAARERAEATRRRTEGMPMTQSSVELTQE